MRRCRNKRAADTHGISAEMIKDGGNAAIQWLTDFFNEVTRTGTIPEQWQVTKLIPLHQGKGCRAFVENYRPIAIVDITYKIFAYVLYFRIRPILEDQLLDEQRGFCRG